MSSEVQVVTFICQLDHLALLGGVAVDVTSHRHSSVEVPFLPGG